jgi:hypothetical protein
MRLLNRLRGRGIKSRVLQWVSPRYWAFNPRYRVKLQRPKMIYIVAMPRTGSTLMKRYLGDNVAFSYDDVETGRRISSDKSLQSKISLRKNTALMSEVGSLFSEHGNEAWFAGLVRDPRDQVLSLMETDRHQEIPKDERFWSFWTQRYKEFLDFVERHRDKGIRICLARYEDLVSIPVVVKADFLRWAGIAEKPESLTAEYHNTERAIAEGVDRSEDWKAHQHNKVHGASVGRWRHISDPRISEIVYHYQVVPEVQAFMRDLGYGENVGPMRIRASSLHILGSD